MSTNTRAQIVTLQREIADKVKKLGLILSRHRLCGCPVKGRHLPVCEERGGVDPSHPWNGYMLECCQSRHRRRHKIGCAFNNQDGRLPPDRLKWKCVDCGTTVETEVQPRQCASKECASPLMVLAN